jgi:heme/copper-type cytochrome/quinol oxidase subunit 3
MKMKKFIISAILIFALTNYAYGMGSHHHHRNSGGSTTTDNSGGNGATLQAFNASGDNSVAVPVPEPATMLLLCSGLIGLLGFRRKFKK